MFHATFVMLRNNKNTPIDSGKNTWRVLPCKQSRVKWILDDEMIESYNKVTWKHTNAFTKGWNLETKANNVKHIVNVVHVATNEESIIDVANSLCPWLGKEGVKISNILSHFMKKEVFMFWWILWDFLESLKLECFKTLLKIVYKA